MEFQRRDDWQTPQWLFDKLHRKFRFTIDAAAYASNAKLTRFWSPDDDGLSHSWAGERIWCNPPYGQETKKWVAKAFEETRGQSMAVLLVPVRAETAWWCDFACRASEIRFIQGRVHFVLPGVSRGDSRPVFASAILVFEPNSTEPLLSSFATPRIQKRVNQLSLFSKRKPSDS